MNRFRKIRMLTDQIEFNRLEKLNKWKGLTELDRIGQTKLNTSNETKTLN